MAVTIRQLCDEVSRFTLQSNQSLSRFSYPQNFERFCKSYLDSSPPDGDYPGKQPRFQTLNFDGFIAYNYHKWPEAGEKRVEEYMGYATVEDIENWKTAIKCLQRYCLNLLLAPRRQDFYQIKVSYRKLETFTAKCWYIGKMYFHIHIQVNCVCVEGPTRFQITYTLAEISFQNTKQFSQHKISFKNTNQLSKHKSSSQNTNHHLIRKITT